MNIFHNPDFASLPDSVAHLFEGASRASFFELSGWYDLVARNGLESGWEPVLIADDSAAFVLKAHSATSALQSCVSPYTCEHAVHATQSSAVLRLAANTARGSGSRYRIQLTGLDPADPAFAAALEGFRAGGFAVKPFVAWDNWYENVNGKTFEEYVAARPSSLVNTWRRKLAALNKTKRWSIDISSPAENPERFIACYEKVYRESWKNPEPFPQFVPSLIRYAAALGALRTGVLKIDDDFAAAQFWIVWQKKALIFKLAHSEKLNDFSPGTILTMSMIENILAADAPAEIDFGRGGDQYKRLWVSSQRSRWGIDALNPRTTRGALLICKMALADMRDRFRRGRQDVPTD